MQEAQWSPSHLLCSLDMWNHRLCLFYHLSDLREKITSYHLPSYFISQAVLWGKSSPYEYWQEDYALCGVWFCATPDLLWLQAAAGRYGRAHLCLESQSCTS